MVATTEHTKRRTRQPRSAVRRFLADPRVTALFLIALALLGIVPAIPRVIAEAALLPARPALERVHRGEILDASMQRDVTAALMQARRFQPGKPEIAIDLALMSLNGIRRDGLVQGENDPALRAAIADLEAGIEMKPADSFAWALLAQVRRVRDGTVSDGVLRALQESYYVGAFDHGAMLARMEVTLPGWRALDDSLRTFARREVLELWRRSWDDQKLIIALTCRTGAVSALSDALRGDARARGEFDQFYEPYLSPEGCRKAP